MAFDATYPSELPTDEPNGTGANSDPADGDDYLKQIHTVINTTFNAVSGAVTATHTELNYLDIATLGTVAASKALVADESANINAAAITWTNLGTVTTGTFTAATITTADINGGTIDATAIGGTTPAAGAFTTLSASGAVSLTSTLGFSAGTTINEFSIDDTLAGDSDNAVPTEQAVKGYVDGQVTTLNASIAAVDSYYAITHEIAAANAAETVYVPVPVAGDIVRMDVCLQAANGAGDLSVDLFQSNDNAICDVTVAGSGAAGDVDSTTTISNEAVTAGSYLKLVGDGNSANAAKLLVTITIQTDTL